MSSSDRGPPPEPNPVLSGYESFVENTPLVTRYVIATLTISWCLSWFVDPSFAIANIPLFTIYHFEVYRVVFSPLVCTSLLSLLFAFISFTDNGKRLEHSMGSTAFAMFLFTIGCVTNLAFLALSLFFYYLTASQAWLVMSSQGIWIILLGLIAVECSNAPEGTKRRLFVFEVPTIYYPLAILALFSLFGGFSVAYLISVGVGYAYGYGYLDKLKISNATFTRWEDGCLNNFTSRKGWVVGNAATGGAAWLPLNNPSAAGEQGEGGWSPTFFAPRQPQSPGTVAAPPDGGWGGGGGGGGEASSAQEKKPSKPSFSSRGQTLGGGTPLHSTAETRAARLAAIEQRSAAASANNDQNA